MTNTLRITLSSESLTAELRQRVDGRWGWFDITGVGEGAEGADMEISGATAAEALYALVASQGASALDGDLSDHVQAAQAIDRVWRRPCAVEGCRLARRGISPFCYVHEAAEPHTQERYAALGVAAADTFAREVRADGGDLATATVGDWDSEAWAVDRPADYPDWAWEVYHGAFHARLRELRAALPEEG